MKNLKVAGVQSVVVDLHPIKRKVRVIIEEGTHEENPIIKGAEEGRMRFYVPI